MKILCTICARGGSKGVKNKNVRELLGKPLIAYTIEMAKKWGKFSDIIVSTDSELIKRISLQHGAIVPFIRPMELATDNAGKIDVIKHAVNYMEQLGEFYDVVIDLDVTSPLRTTEDIENAYQKLVTEQLDIVYSVCEARKSPYFNMVEIDSDGIPRLCKKPEKPVLSRQTAPKVYELNASIYVYRKEFLLKTNTIHAEKAGIYIMPQERSIDIDSELDFRFVEFMMGNLQK
ncbi:MAG: hypothetical protein JG767_1758 [Deferribacteraceae bacterium]|jgi:CMP-N-acetylneuraminic acid synthetase|nr:hypothetical protein [Deferribacteraceae bacterium]